MRILTSEQAREADRHAMEELGVSQDVLMENAGAEVVSAIEDALGELAGLNVLVLCGKGNNGCDGMVVARRLAALGAGTRAVLLADPEELSPEGRQQWSLLRRVGVPVLACGPKDWPAVRADVEVVDLVVDALLGTGFRGALEGLLAKVVEDLNASETPVVSVDVPSGLSGDSAEVTGPAVRASLTVTFAAPKICHVFAPAQEHCGDLVVADIGIPEESLAAAESGLVLIEDDLVAEIVEELADRPQDSHKGTWGHVVIVGGSVGRSGAPALAGLGALTAGCGLVTIATPEPCVSAVAAHAPELMQVALASTLSGEVAEAPQPLDELLARASVLVIGPGLGTGAGARSLLAALLAAAQVPVVLDADALNLAAQDDELLAPSEERPLVLTPHPGEFARLLGHESSKLRTQHARLPQLVELTDRHQAVIVLKGFRTMVAAPDADVHVALTGNPGMATAGTGDVLAGFIGGLAAQSVDPLLAAIAAVHLHGRAGDLAERDRGQMALRATDLLGAWPAAVRSLTGGEDEG